MMRKLFIEDSDLDVWIDGEAETADSKVLLTISNVTGTRTVLITPHTIAECQAKYFVEAPPERIISSNQLRIKKAQIAIRYLGYCFSAIILTFAALSTTGAVKARVVLTGSMAPAISPGDIVLLASPSRLAPEVGEVATYTARRFSGEEVGLFTHRIIGGDANSGFTMKGDANAAPDTQRPKIDDIDGVVFFVIPFLGYLFSARTLIILIPLLVGLWFIADALRNSDE